MKAKFTVLLIVAAAITLSFTFSLKHSNEKPQAETTATMTDNEPVGGLGSEDKL
jgi:hypothetical protein